MMDTVRNISGRAAEKPAFLLSIDTEGDNFWGRPGTITTHNAADLSRFQQLCERYRLMPTYLTSYEMARSSVFQEFARDVLQRGTAEIGMHLHAWNTPPLHPLTSDDLYYQPYLIEYPAQIMREKIRVMTDLLEETFGVKMVSHRAGRWSFDATYATILAELGYRVDCSVTPYVSWRSNLGDPAQQGGTDFSAFPTEAYFLDLTQIDRPGQSSLLELPVTILPTAKFISRLVQRIWHPSGSFTQRLCHRLFPSTHWLLPTRRNRRMLLPIVARARQMKMAYLQLPLHSSELMPHGSPNFRTPRDIARLYDDLERLFSEVQHDYQGMTLQAFYERMVDRAHPAV